MKRILLTSAALAMMPLAAAAATFFQFAFDWSSDGRSYSLFGATAAGQNATDVNYEVSDRLRFSIDGTEQGFNLYDGILRNAANTAWVSRPDRVDVRFAEDAGGGFTASFQNLFVWFTDEGWNFGAADQEGRRGYTVQNNGFFTFTQGRLVDSGTVQQGEFVPSLQAAFRLRDTEITNTTLTGTAAVIPLPPALPMLASALLGLGLLLRKRRAT